MRKKNLLFLFLMIASFSVYSMQSPDGGKNPKEFVSIHDIQYTTDDTGDSPYLGTTVSTGGIVTAINEGYGFFIQSGSGPWSGIYVYDNTNTVAIGDSVTFTGLVDEYYNLTELKELTDLTIVSHNNELKVSGVTTADINKEEYEGCLVSIYNAVCTNTDLGYGEWEVDDGSGPCRVDDLMVEYAPESGSPYSVTGVVYFSYSNYKLEPRDMNDIKIVTGMADQAEFKFHVFPNPTTDILKVSSKTNKEGEVILYDALGKTIVKEHKDFSRFTIDLSGLPEGIYFMKIANSEKVYKIYKK